MKSKWYVNTVWRKKIEEGKVEETFVVSLLRRRVVRQNWRVECDVTFFPPQVHITKLDNYFWEEEKNQGKSLWKEDLLLLMRFFSFWEGVDDFWSVSNSRRHRCNRKAICPYRICYVISQDWASFFDDGKCVKIASASFLVIGNGTPSFHFLDPATADS